MFYYKFFIFMHCVLLNITKNRIRICYWLTQIYVLATSAKRLYYIVMKYNAIIYLLLSSNKSCQKYLVHQST